MERILFLSSLLLAGLASGGEPEVVGTLNELENALPAARQLAGISASATWRVQADKAVVKVIVVTEDKALAEALKENEVLRAQLIRSLNEHGIQSDQIQSARFSTVPEPARLSDKVRSYRVENQVDITVHDESQFQAVAELVDRHKEVTYFSLTPKHENQKGRRLKALSLACDKVLKKRASLEEILGVQLAPKEIMPREPDQDTKSESGFGEQEFSSHLSVTFQLINP